MVSQNTCEISDEIHVLYMYVVAMQAGGVRWNAVVGMYSLLVWFMHSLRQVPWTYTNSGPKLQFSVDKRNSHVLRSACTCNLISASTTTDCHFNAQPVSLVDPAPGVSMGQGARPGSVTLCVEDCALELTRRLISTSTEPCLLLHCSCNVL